VPSGLFAEWRQLAPGPSLRLGDRYQWLLLPDVIGRLIRNPSPARVVVTRYALLGAVTPAAQNTPPSPSGRLSVARPELPSNAT
jgi:hypothetical protein